MSTWIGLGYCGRGMLKFRIVIPLHDEHGQLVGYAGRLTKDRDISDDNPKYRFPGDRERDGRKITFAKSRLVYNLHRLPKQVDELVVVEGFKSVWHLTRLGFPNVVALMGSFCSPEQAARIAERLSAGARLFFLPDGNPAGTDLAMSLFRELGPDRWCRWCTLADDAQPTDLERDELCDMLS